MNYPTPRWSLIVAVLLFAGPLLGAIPFPQASSDLAPDPALHFGVLPNGFRYVIMPNHEPRERVSLRLLVLCGSIDESDTERGLAHYLEHMAFNGSTHFAPDTLVKYFQRMGMRMGADANANTSFLRTIYQVDLPDHQPDTISQGLQVFSDYAGGLLLTPAMVDKERPIILAEKRTSDSIQFRQYVAQFQFLLPDSLFPKRITIGEKSDIDAASREQFLDIYNTWYRPERMAIVVVGAIDPAAVEEQIKAAFAGLTARAPARPEPDLGHVTVALGLKTYYRNEPEAPLTTVGITVVAPYTYQPDNSVLRRNHLIRALATSIMNRRLSVLEKRENAPIMSGQVFAGERYNFYRQASVTLACAPGRWQEALALGEQELRKALQYGFTPGELKEAVADMRNGFERRAETASTRLSNVLVDEITESLLDKEVFTSPADDLAMARPILDRVSPEDCVAALRYAFGTPGRYVMINGNANIDGDSNQVIAEAYKASQMVAVAAPEREKDESFLYTDFGTPGKITERKQVDDLDLTQVSFANGVRVNLKKTAFEADVIRIGIRLGAGGLTEPKDEAGLSFFVSQTFSEGGLGKHSVDDLRRITAGRTVQGRFSVGADALDWRYQTKKADLLFVLQLITAHITDPGYRPEAERVLKRELPAIYNQLAHVPQGPLQLEVPRLLASGDFRFGIPSGEIIALRTLDQEKAWINPQLANGPIEIGISGDFDLDATLDALSRTLGALPNREVKPAYASERQVHFAEKPFDKSYTIDSKIPKAVVALYWPTTDAWDVVRTRRLQLLADVLRDRLRIAIRERLGDAYGVSTNNASSEAFPGYGVLTVTTVVAPDKTAETKKAILDVAQSLAKDGVTDEELERAKKPALAALRDSERTNQYWLNAVLMSCQEFPQKLDWARSRAADMGAITASELSALAKTYLAPDRVCQVQVVPSSPPGPAPVQGGAG